MLLLVEIVRIAAIEVSVTERDGGLVGRRPEVEVKKDGERDED